MPKQAISIMKEVATEELPEPEKTLIRKLMQAEGFLDKNFEKGTKVETVGSSSDEEEEGDVKETKEAEKKEDGAEKAKTSTVNALNGRGKDLIHDDEDEKEPYQGPKDGPIKEEDGEENEEEGDR